jgi:replicative DNA helicase
MKEYTTSALLDENILKLREFALRRGMIQLCTETMNEAYNLVSSPADALDKMQAGLNSLTDSLVLTSSKDGREVVNECIAEMEDAKFVRGTVAVSSGIRELDEIVSQGWRPGDMIVIAARPSVGKTAFAVNLALNAVKGGKKVGLFSAEMADVQIGYRIISNMTGIPGTLLRSDQDMSLADWTAVRNLVKGPSPLDDLYVDDTPAISIAEFTAKARKMVREGVGLVFVDYLQLMTAGVSRNSVREQEVAAISHALKAAAKKYGIPVIALAQLSRQAQHGAMEGRGPQLSDLRESGAIEQDADIVLFLSPTEDWSGQAEGKRLIKLDVAKNRNGQTGSLTLTMTPETMTFRTDGESLAAYAATSWVPLT